MKLRSLLIGLLFAGGADAFLAPAVARGAGLRFVTPRPNQVVGGDNVFLWAAEAAAVPPARGAQLKERQVVFEASTDNRRFLPLPRQSAPDYGPFSQTSAFDATAFPSGLLFLRVRYADQPKGPTIRVRINQLPKVDCKGASEIPGSFTVFFACTGSRDPDGRIVLYLWDFGDGTRTLKTDKPIAVHSYASSGTYPLEVTAFDDGGLSSTWMRLVTVSTGLVGLVPSEKCGCKEMIVTAKGNSTLKDGRRKDLAPLGRDPAFVSFNFEVLAILEPGSNPALCTEGQWLKRTSTGTFETSGFTHHKVACAAGQLLTKCTKNADCDNFRCTAKPHRLCNDLISRLNCRELGGTCERQGDGVCKPFPFGGATRGSDDYRRAGDEGVKFYGPGPVIRWFDGPGLADRQAKIRFDYRFDGDFHMFVNGTNGGGNCQCHVQLVIDWDHKRRVYRGDTGINLMIGEETSASCSVAQ